MNHDKVGEEKRKTWNEKDKNPSCLTCYTVYAKKMAICPPYTIECNYNYWLL